MSIATPPTPTAGHEPPPVIRNLTVEGRLGPAWLNQVRRWTGWPWEIRLAKAALAVPRIRQWEKKFVTLTDAEMKECGLQMRGRARGGEHLDKLLPEAFALVSAGAQRLLKLRPHDVQLAAGYVM